MADPTKYSRGYGFANYQATLPNKPLPGVQLDVQLDDISASLGGAIDAIKDIRRADGLLQNGVVSPDSLSATLISDIAAGVLVALGSEAEETVRDALPQWRGGWETTTDYEVNDLAREAGSTYICMELHTSGNFSTDLAAGRWQLFAAQGIAGPGTGDMLAANNLSDLASAATARANLGATTVGTALFTAANEAAARTALGTPATAAVQPVNANLTSLSGLTFAANKGLYATAANTAALFDLTAAGRALLDDADAAAQRTTLGLGNLSTLNAIDFFKDQAVWNAGTDTGQATISPAQLDTKVDASRTELASGAAGAPRVQGLALGGLPLTTISRPPTTATPIGLTDLGDISELLFVGGLSLTNPEGLTGPSNLQVRFSADNGATFGAYQNVILGPASDGQEIGPLTMSVNLETGQCIATRFCVLTQGTKTFNGTLTVPTGCDALQLRIDTSNGAFGLSVFIIGGRVTPV